jgi:hypothetical protein
LLLLLLLITGGVAFSFRTRNLALSALPCLVPLPKEMENLKLSMKRQ